MSEGPTVAIDLGVTTVAAAVDASLSPDPADGRAPAEYVEPADVPLDLAAVFAPADGTALAVGAAARRLAPTDPSRYEPTPRLRRRRPRPPARHPGGRDRGGVGRRPRRRRSSGRARC